MAGSRPEEPASEKAKTAAWSSMGRPAHFSKNSRSELVPGLNPCAPYTSRLSARSALYTDLQLLLDARDQTGIDADYRSLIIEGNCLARGSTAARHKMWKELRTRYILDGEHPLFAAFLAEWSQCNSEPERGLTAYLLLALNDRLVADLGIEFLFPLLRRAPAELRVGDVRGFIDRSSKNHEEVLCWSDQTRKAVAQKYTASMRDFGLAKGTVRKTTVRPALHPCPMRLLVRALRIGGAKDFDVISSPAFRLLALEGSEVIDALSELNRQESLSFRTQGDVVELAFGGTR